MKKLLLGLMVLVLSTVFLAGCSGNDVVPPQDNNIARFVGWWFNVDENTNNQTKLYIAEVGNSLAVEVWGKCDPEDCYWGKKLVESSDAIDGVLEIVWIFSFGEYAQELLLLNSNNLKLTTSILLTNGQELTTVDYLQK